MAITLYTTDLTTYNNCTTNTGWGELIGMALKDIYPLDYSGAILIKDATVRWISILQTINYRQIT